MKDFGFIMLASFAIMDMFSTRTTLDTTKILMAIWFATMAICGAIKEDRR